LDEVAPQFFAGMFNQKWKSEKKTPGIAIEKGVMQRIIEGWIEKKKNGEHLKQPVSEPVGFPSFTIRFAAIDLSSLIPFTGIRLLPFDLRQERSTPSSQLVQDSKDQLPR